MRDFLHELAVTQREDSIAERRGQVIVRDQQNRGVEFAVQIVEQAKNFVSGVRIEIAGGFVAQQNRRTKHQRAGDGHALALAAGKLVRAMMRAHLESDALQHGQGTLVRLALAHTLQTQRQRDVFDAR